MFGEGGEEGADGAWCGGGGGGGRRGGRGVGLEEVGGAGEFGEVDVSVWSTLTPSVSSFGTRAHVRFFQMTKTDVSILRWYDERYGDVGRRGREGNGSVVVVVIIITTVVVVDVYVDVEVVCIAGQWYPLHFALRGFVGGFAFYISVI